MILYASDAVIQSDKIIELMKEEVDQLRGFMEALNVKQKEYADMIQSYSDAHSADESEIKKIEGFCHDTHNIL